jgi:hypothetical protein
MPRSREEVLKEFNGDRFATMQDAVLAMADRIRSLEATPARGVVTDEMVERAAKAHYEYASEWSWSSPSEGYRNVIRAEMRIALDAALTEGTPDAA